MFIGNNVAFTNVRKPRASRSSKKLKTIVEDNASIGANATIVGGVRIGRNSVISDGSVVIKNVPENTYVAGNPARIIGSTDKI